MNTLLGVPYFACAAVCLLVAGVYFLVVPKRPPAVLKAGERIILRYFHSLVWVIFAVNCLAANAGLWKVVDVLLWLSLAVYAIFVATLVVARGRK